MLYYLLVLVFSVVHVSESEKVFGGRYAKDGEFPFVVSIRGKIRCAGSLVTLAKVVTAAHCLKILGTEQDNDDMIGSYVTGGSVNLEKFSVELEVRTINSILVSGKYIPRSRFHQKVDSHDIGLGMLDYPFDPGRTLQVMNLVSWNATIYKHRWDEIVAKGTICYAMGWGMTAYRLNNFETDDVPIKPSSILKVIQVTPSDNESCSMMFPRKEDMTMYGEICVYSVKNSETICNGDSGGPLVCDGRPYALLNYGPRCGTTFSHQGYLLYWYYLDFLTLSGTHLLPSKLLIFFPLSFLLLCYHA